MDMLKINKPSFYIILGMMAGLGFARVTDILFPPDVSIFSYYAGALYVGISLAVLHYEDYFLEKLGVKNETT